jgi:hypothetical protein
MPYIAAVSGIGTMLEALMIWQLLQLRRLFGKPIISRGLRRESSRGELQAPGLCREPEVFGCGRRQAAIERWPIVQR